jgi:hypothetical protein
MSDEKDPKKPAEEQTEGCGPCCDKCGCGCGPEDEEQEDK